jgi:hypothetical protein
MKLERSKRKAASVRCVVATLGLGVLMGASPSAHAYVYSSEGQWASWMSGSYTIYNDVWGNSNPSQWLNINSISSWNIVSNQTGGGVKSYGNISFSPNQPVTANNIWVYFNCSTPSGAGYDNSFDCWDNNGDEIMIWENWANVSPAGSVKYSNVSIAGSSWNVWVGNVGHPVVSFTRNGQRWSGTEYPSQLIAWAKNNKLITGSTITQVQLGFEVSNTSGWQTFTMNGYNAGW